MLRWATISVFLPSVKTCHFFFERVELKSLSSGEALVVGHWFCLARIYLISDVRRDPGDCCSEPVGCGCCNSTEYEFSSEQALSSWKKASWMRPIAILWRLVVCSTNILSLSVRSDWNNLIALRFTFRTGVVLLLVWAFTDMKKKWRKSEKNLFESVFEWYQTVHAELEYILICCTIKRPYQELAS